MDCVFCKIIQGEIDSAKIWEDDDTMAFLDISPITQGHTLVIPKKHFQDIFDINDSVLQKIVSNGKKISERLKVVLNAQGVRLAQSNGEVAGQEVFHFHLHVIPRYPGDGINMSLAGTVSSPKTDIKDLKELAEHLRF